MPAPSRGRWVTRRRSRTGGPVPLRRRKPGKPAPVAYHSARRIWHPSRSDDRTRGSGGREGQPRLLPMSRTHCSAEGMSFGFRVSSLDLPVVGAPDDRRVPARTSGGPRCSPTRNLKLGTRRSKLDGNSACTRESRTVRLPYKRAHSRPRAPLRERDIACRHPMM